MISNFELGWLVGILEGEGYFGYYTASQYVEISSTDEDVINHVAILYEKLTGHEYNITARQQGGHKKPAYRIRAGGSDARFIMKYLLKHMSQRRRKRIWQSLNRYQPKKTKPDISTLVNVILPVATSNVVKMKRRM